nr:MAG TPA: hypothetical protein [Caudoviricetes sp.]
MCPIYITFLALYIGFSSALMLLPNSLFLFSFSLVILLFI